jgi:hypothetical protein
VRRRERLRHQFKERGPPTPGRVIRRPSPPPRIRLRRAAHARRSVQTLPTVRRSATPRHRHARSRRDRSGNPHVCDGIDRTQSPPRKRLKRPSGREASSTLKA